eukprot:SAG31_NODE_1196_length_9445_cov_9.153970_5_plen_61_part_00
MLVGEIAVGLMLPTLGLALAESERSIRSDASTSSGDIMRPNVADHKAMSDWVDLCPKLGP